MWQPCRDPRSADGEGALFSHAATLGMGGSEPGVFGAAHSGQVRSGQVRLGVKGGGKRKVQGGRAPAGVSSLFALRQQIHQ